MGLGVSHTLLSLPSSAGRRLTEYSRDPCPEWVPVSPILGQDNPFKLKDSQTKAPLSVSQPKAHFQHLQKAAKSGHSLPPPLCSARRCHPGLLGPAPGAGFQLTQEPHLLLLTPRGIPARGGWVGPVTRLQRIESGRSDGRSLATLRAALWRGPCDKRPRMAPLKASQELSPRRTGPAGKL